MTLYGVLPELQFHVPVRYAAHVLKAGASGGPDAAAEGVTPVRAQKRDDKNATHGTTPIGGARTRATNRGLGGTLIVSWDAIAAVASIASVVVLAVASIAAFLQLKHLRLANQLECYAHFIEVLQSPEIVEARAYLQEHDFSKPEVVQRAISPQIDPRIIAVGGHFQAVCRLMNRGVLDEYMFLTYISILPQIWSKLKPIAYALRERESSPRWLDLEYLAYRASRKKSLIEARRSLPEDFLKQTNLAEMLRRNQERIDELVTRA